ncbi:MAG: hypothetical protein MSA25_03300, partial [Clostridiales bacterium]|nr:hypothetical protein [Clostridiales bacterium]
MNEVRFSRKCSKNGLFIVGALAPIKPPVQLGVRKNTLVYARETSCVNLKKVWQPQKENTGGL